MKRKKYLKGSYTVEAALLSTILLSVLVFLFFWCLMIYNRTILQIYAIRGAKQAFYYAGIQSSEAASACKSIATSEVVRKCVATEEIETEVIVEKKQVIVRMHTVSETVSLIPPGLADDSVMDMELKWEEKRGRPAELYRETRKYLLYLQLIREYMKENEE